MEAYLNELSVKAFSNNKDAQDAFSLLGRCLSKMSELGVSNVRMTNEAMGKGMLPGQTWNRILNNETVIDKDRGNYNNSGMSRREYVNANRIQADAPDSIVITVRKGDTVSAGDLDIQKQNMKKGKIHNH